MTVTPIALIYNKASKYQLLFIHGFMAGPSSLEVLLPELSHLLGTDLSVAAITLPGHSGCPPSALTFEQYTELLAHAIGELAQSASSKLVVYGYSMGGRLALEALIAPALPAGAVAGLILESASWGLAGAADRKARLLKDRQLLAQVTDEACFRRFLTAWYRLPLFRGLTDCPGYSKLIAQRLRQNPSWLQAALNQFSVGHQQDRSRQLIGLDLPKLYVAGAWDEAYRRRISELPLDESPATFKATVIPAASHNTHVMAPRATASAIAGFLRSLP